MFKVEIPAKNKGRDILRRCIRKGSVICYLKDDVLSTIPSITTKSSTNQSFVPECPTFNDNEEKDGAQTVLNYEEYETCESIAYCKSAMEKNLTPIKCAIIENKKKREKELLQKRESEMKFRPTELTPENINKAKIQIHAEYKQLWKEALRELEDRKLGRVKLTTRPRCDICKQINQPMEEYNTDPDLSTIKEDISNLNEWVSVSTKPKRTTGAIRCEYKKESYKFVNIIEQKKKSGAYKDWRSNLVRPLCSCAKENCECNINPAIISIQRSDEHEDNTSTVSKEQQRSNESLISTSEPLVNPMDVKRKLIEKRLHKKFYKERVTPQPGAHKSSLTKNYPQKSIDSNRVTSSRGAPNLKAQLRDFDEKWPSPPESNFDTKTNKPHLTRDSFTSEPHKSGQRTGRFSKDAQFEPQMGRFGKEGQSDQQIGKFGREGQSEPQMGRFGKEGQSGTQMGRFGKEGQSDPQMGRFGKDVKSEPQMGKFGKERVTGTNKPGLRGRRKESDAKESINEEQNTTFDFSEAPTELLKIHDYPKVFKKNVTSSDYTKFPFEYERKTRKSSSYDDLKMQQNKACPRVVQNKKPSKPKPKTKILLGDLDPDWLANLLSTQSTVIRQGFNREMVETFADVNVPDRATDLPPIQTPFIIDLSESLAGDISGTWLGRRFE